MTRPFSAIKPSLTLAIAAVIGAGFSSTVSGQVPSTWAIGDVFVGVGSGSYEVFDSRGGHKETLTGTLDGYTTDCGFDPAMERLFTTNYTHSKVVIFEPGADAQTVHADDTSPDGHSGAIVFAANGSFFVGHPDGNHLIHKYNDSGMLLDTYAVETEERGSNWIDLAADQNVLFYTSEGRTVHRYDTASRQQLDSFAEIPGTGHAFALRLLPPGDGSGGLLVADGERIVRLDEQGHVARIYDDKGQDSWFALNLDPNGNSFWAADSETDRLYRFSLATGEIERQFQAGDGGSIFGVCLKGELTAGTAPNAVITPGSYSLSQNSPNPFNPSTQIEFRLPSAGDVNLTIFNVLGQEVATLVDNVMEAGVHAVSWEGTDAAGRQVSSGLYFYKFESDGLVQTRRMMMLK